MADADGLRAVSMSVVAKRAGFTTMSLYRYVASKDELLVLMVDRAVGPPPAWPSAADGEPGWRAGLVRWCRESAAILWRHPWVLDVRVDGPPLTPSQLQWMEYGLRALAGTRLAVADKAAVILLLNNFVWGYAQIFRAIPASPPAASSAAPAAAASSATAVPATPTYGQLLRQLIDDDQYPELSAVVASGIFDGPAEHSDEDFEWGLDRVLDGVDALVRRGSG